MKLSHINSKQLFRQQDLPLNKPKLISGITLGQNRNLHVVELNNKYLVYKCERCGVEKQEKINDNFDIIFDYVTEVLNIYFPYIISILIVTSSTWSIFMGIKIIVAKKNDEKEKAYKMIKNYIIGLIAIFILLGAFPYIIKLIISII